MGILVYCFVLIWIFVGMLRMVVFVMLIIIIGKVSGIDL